MNNIRYVALADDESSVRGLNKIIIGKLFPNVEIREAENGQELVNLVREGFQPELIVTDYNMPILRGVEALRNIREFGNKAPALVVTGNTSDLEQDGINLVALNNKFTNYNLPHEYLTNLITKPYGIQDLKDAITSLLQTQ